MNASKTEMNFAKYFFLHLLHASLCSDLYLFYDTLLSFPYAENHHHLKDGDLGWNYITFEAECISWRLILNQCSDGHRELKLGRRRSHWHLKLAPLLFFSASSFICHWIQILENQQHCPLTSYIQTTCKQLGCNKHWSRKECQDGHRNSYTTGNNDEERW